MEKYIINGVEFEYDTFDLDEMELFDSEVKRVQKEAEAVEQQEWEADDYLQILREQGENILDFFDTVLGEGSARKIFGSRMNIRDIVAAYKQFNSDVVKVRGDLGGLAGGSAEGVSAENREQRRAADREKRRREAAERVKKRREQSGEG